MCGLLAVWTLTLKAHIHYRGSIDKQLMQCYMSKSVSMKNQLYILHGLRIQFLVELLLKYIIGYTIKHGIHAFITLKQCDSSERNISICCR